MHHRTFTDIALAAENSYHNPLIDIPVYLLVKYFNNQPWVYYTYFGVFWGLRILYKNNVHLPQNSLILTVTYGTGAAAARIAENNPSVKFTNITAPFTMESTKLAQKIEQYKKDSNYIAYMAVIKTPLTSFDYHMPTKYVFADKRMKNSYENVRYVLQNAIGIDKFYCQDISNAPHMLKVFLCIDKKDRRTIFLSSQQSVIFRPHK